MEVGISIPDLDLLTIGLVLDIWTEKGNDSVEYATLATQDDFDRWSWDIHTFSHGNAVFLRLYGKGVDFVSII